MNTGLFHRPESLRHDSNVRLLLYREASWPLDHGETCRREDSNLGRAYANGSEPFPVARLGTATRGTAAETRLACRLQDRIRANDRKCDLRLFALTAGKVPPCRPGSNAVSRSRTESPLLELA